MSSVEVTAKLDVTVPAHQLPAVLAECARYALSADGAAVITTTDTNTEIAATAPAHYQIVRPLSADPTLTVTRRKGRTIIRIPLPDVANLNSVIVELRRRTPQRIIVPAAALLSELLRRYVYDRDEISRQLRTDPLTALGNRTAADDALNELQTGDSVMIFDVDHFKNINDLLGHAGGDTVLRQVASFLRAQLRSTDTICRYGGDEFLTVLRATPQPEQIAQGIIQRWTDADPLATLSCGLATCASGDTGPTVLERADQALYQAKRAGRARLRTNDNNATATQRRHGDT